MREGKDTTSTRCSLVTLVDESVTRAIIQYGLRRMSASRIAFTIYPEGGKEKRREEDTY